MFVVALLALGIAGNAADLPPGAVLRLGDIRFRAAGEVRHLRFSADGSTLDGWVLRGGWTLTPVSWDVVSGAPLKTVPTRSPPDLAEGSTASVRLSRNRVLTAGPGNAGRVWDATTTRQLAQLTGHVERVTAVAGAATGKLLATASADGLVRMWDGETFRPLLEPRGHIAPIHTIRVSVDGKRAVTLGDDGSARVWNLATGAELRAFATTGSVEFTRDGLGLVMQANASEVVVRDILTGLETVPAEPPSLPEQTLNEWLARLGMPMAVSPNGQMVAVSRPDGSISLYERATKGWRRDLIGHGSRCRAMTFTPDGSRLLTAGADHTVLVWDVTPQSMPLPATVRRETNAAKLWASMRVGKADAAYLAMARLAVEPAAAVATARMRIRPADGTEQDTFASWVADSRAIELLESLGTKEAREFLQQLAGGETSAWRTQQAKQALTRATTR